MNMHPATATNPVRHSACAGRFYPADPRELRTLVETCLQTARGAAGTAPKAIIAPHAGYIYSGPIAGSAYARWRGENGRIRRVVVIGPSHFAEFAGLALSSAQAFETPLGRVPVDTDAIATIRAVPWVHTVDRAHAPEHCLEVQLPFLQKTLKNFLAQGSPPLRCNRPARPDPCVSANPSSQAPVLIESDGQRGVCGLRPSRDFGDSDSSRTLAP